MALLGCPRSWTPNWHQNSTPTKRSVTTTSYPAQSVDQRRRLLVTTVSLNINNRSARDKRQHNRNQRTAELPWPTVQPVAATRPAEQPGAPRPRHHRVAKHRHRSARDKRQQHRNRRTAMANSAAVAATTRPDERRGAPRPRHKQVPQHINTAARDTSGSTPTPPKTVELPWPTMLRWLLRHGQLKGTENDDLASLAKRQHHCARHKRQHNRSDRTDDLP